MFDAASVASFIFKLLTGAVLNYLPALADSILFERFNELSPYYEDDVLSHVEANELIYREGFRFTLKQWAFIKAGNKIRKNKVLKSKTNNKFSIDPMDLYY